MALRAKAPEAIQKRLKALFYGGAGVGKTTAAISFPRPYLIDTERGAENTQYTEKLKANGGVIFQTSDFDELVTEVKSLLTEKHEYKTLIIDPLTTLYNDLLEKSARERISDKDPDGTAFGGHYGSANKKIKHLLALLLRLDMNVIITCHSKNEYGANLSILGQTYDGYKKLDYLFDLVFEIKKFGLERKGIVKKTRLQEFQDSDQFPFSYDEIATRYGREILERDAVAEVLASKEQVERLNELVELFKVPEETLDKWKDKANATEFAEMNESVISKIIAHLEEKIKPKGETA